MTNGPDDAALAGHLAILGRDPTNLTALLAVGSLALAGFHDQAARTAFEQAARCHPDNAAAHVSLGNLLFDAGDFAAALTHFQAGAAADPNRADTHQGLARTLAALGRHEAAEPHWRAGFRGHAIAPQPWRGTGTAVPVLLLVSVRHGNIPTRRILDNRVFAVTALYAEFYDPDQPLPPHAIVFNAIGDADLCPEALTAAEAVVARTSAPVINPPADVRLTGRVDNARRLGRLTGVVAPQTRMLDRSAAPDLGDLVPPLLVRAPGFHTGQHFIRIDRPDQIAPALAALPGERFLAIRYLDARGADGMSRKYRVMIIDGVIRPLHLAIAADWKVHYFTAGMASNAAWRQEERRFLDDMPAVLGARAMDALERIGGCLGLDYAGVDFALDPDGALLLFEANATMVINPPDPDPMWDYRREPIDRTLDAARRMVQARARAIA